MAASLSHDVDIMRRSVEQLLDATKWDMSEIGEHDAMIYQKTHKTLFLSLLCLQSCLFVIIRYRALKTVVVERA